MMNFGSNSAGLVSANIFLQQFAPKYTQPLIISASIAAAGIVLLACLRRSTGVSERIHRS